MHLNPKLPPGRANRKALQFAVDIQRLRNAGYTFSAIRTALLDAGIRVSLTTIKREAARRDNAAPRAQPEGMAQRQPAASPAVPPAPPLANGREIAAAFFDANPSNPLLRSKETP
jgi:hypothetical protein